MRIEVALTKYLQQLEADGRSEHTIGQYGRHVRLLSTWLGPRRQRVEAISHEVIAEFLTSNEARTRPDGKPKKGTSANALRTSVRTFFGYLHDAGYITSNPARLVRRARCGAPPPRGLTKDEQARLLDTLAKAEGREAERDHALFALMLATGIRLGSAVALDVEDVDLEAGELLLRRTKGDRPERVFLGKRVRKHLKRYIGDRSTGPLFEGHPGRRMTSRHVRRRLQMWCRRAGVRVVSPHALRHSFAMDLYRRRGDILLVQKALHHRSIVSSLAYARAGEEDLRKVLA